MSRVVQLVWIPRRLLPPLVLSAVCAACGTGHARAPRTAARPSTATALTASQTAPRPVDPSKFPPGACVAFPAPTGTQGNPTVFLDAGHGGPDPGAVGATARGRTIREADLTLAVELKTMTLLRAAGFRVVVSRTRDTTVLPLGPDDRGGGGVLTVEGSHEDLLARDACANEAGANVLVGIYFDAGAPGSAGAVTGYDAVRPFAAQNLRLARLLEADALDAMNAQGWGIPDEGVKRDTTLGSALNSAGLAYGHLVLLGPAFDGYVPAPSRMPGALIEPLFITDPSEGSIASSQRGQQVIAGAVASAIEQYFAAPHPILAGKIPDLLPTRRRVVALTFDAGADNAGAPKILPALARAHATATFFMTGRWAELYPSWARRIAALYPIGNHTFDHQDLLTLTLPEVRGELLNAAAAIKRAIGQPPLPVFRFPYGSSNASTLALVNRLGYTAVGWTVDTLGWEGTSMGQTRASVISRALGHLQPGEIVLMHVGANPHDQSTLDADALPGIIGAIRARGYGFVALSQYF
jgi:peptidoglycan/xylan/chitin deacetylase (PgdA/CDA1 family)/N-acetylmuramoyl-L-alanine amidase